MTDKVVHANTVNTFKTSLDKLQHYHDIIYRVSKKSNNLRTFASISASGHPLQMKIYPVIFYSYPHFGAFISIFVRTATLFVTLTPKF